ncbi:MAG: nitroreductase family protein [Candidatus Bathyarchaeia archaeon]
MVKTRRSIRRYKPDPVSDEIIRQLIDAARHAPSADDIQPWEFIVVRDKQVKEELSKTHAWSRFVKDAPVCIVALGNERLSPSYFAIDTTCAIQNLLLASHSLGLGACWVAVYDLHNPSYERHVRTVLNVPSHLRVVAMIPVGYPDEKAGRRALRETSEILHFNRYGQHIG